MNIGNSLLKKARNKIYSECGGDIGNNFEAKKQGSRY
jgi:hypothetical protein